MKRFGTQDGLTPGLIIWLASLLAMVAGACTSAAPTADEATETEATTVATSETDDETEAPDPSPADDAWLNVRVPSDIPDYNPYARGAPNTPSLRNMYEPLVDYDESGEPVPVLAESYQIADDNASVTVALREGVTFHNGENLTADHVVEAYELAADPEVGGALAGVVEDVEGVVAANPQTVEFSLVGPRPDQFITDVLQAILIGLPGNQDNVTERGIGTGPFQQGDREPGESYTLVRYDDYWGEAPQIAGINYRVIADDSAAVAALRSGEIDVVERVPPTSIQVLQDVAHRVDHPNSPGTMVISPNPQRAPFDREEIRRALSQAINREAIVNAAYLGESQEKVLLWPQDSPAFDAEQTAEYAYDSEAARVAFEDAGITELGPILVPNVLPAGVTAAQVIQETLSEIGVSVRVEIMDIAEFVGLLQGGDYSLMIFGMGFENKHPVTVSNFIMLRTESNPLYPDGPPEYYLNAVADSREAVTEQEQEQAFEQLNEALLRLSAVIPISRNPILIYEAEGVEGTAMDIDARPIFHHTTVPAR